MIVVKKCREKGPNGASQKEEKEYGTAGILFEEPNTTGSRPRDLIGLYKHQRKPTLTHTPNTQERERKGSTTERRSGRNGAKERRRKPLEMGTDGEEATGEARKRQKGEKDTAKRHARDG